MIGRLPVLTLPLPIPERRGRMSMHTSPNGVFARRESEARSYCRGFNVEFTTAQGSEMFDAAGGRYIDFLAGCSSLNYGHNDPDMKAALIEHMTDDGIAHGLDLHTGAKAAFSRRSRRIFWPRRAWITR
jgi:diaminobutyrate-2-oxoglutarate transaminase